MKKLFVILLLFPCFLNAQVDTVNKVLYTFEYQFKEGIFINFDQVLQNKPLDKIRIITQVKTEDEDFYDELLKLKTISFIDDYGINQTVLTDNIWGYCRNNDLYIYFNNEFNKISLIGSLCHFTSLIRTYQERFNDPFYGYNSIGFSPVQTTEMREYIFDFNTGSIMDLSIENLDKILKRDQALYDEFSNLNKKKKRQMVYYFLRKYNEANPLYLVKPQ